MKTKERLAAELNKAGLGNMALLAAQGYYDDWESSLATPIVQLVTDLRAAGAHAFAQRVMNGEFDSTKEEAEAWERSPDGQATLGKLSPAMRAAITGKPE